MKKIIILSFFMTLTSVAFAGDKCEQRARELVSKLEGVLVDLEGVAQGDYDEEQLSIEIEKSTKNTITFRVRASHTNEDNDAWDNLYRVSLGKDGCYIKSYVFEGVDG